MTVRTRWALLTLLCAGAPAQARHIDPHEVRVADGPVEALVRSGPRIYLGGSFSYLGARTGPVAMFDRTGLRADPELTGTAETVVPDGRGGAYAAGSFFAGPRHRAIGVVHLLADGSPDAAFTPLPGAATALTLSDGRLYAAVRPSGPWAFESAVVALDRRTGIRRPGFDVTLGRPNSFVPIGPGPDFAAPPVTAPCALPPRGPWFRFPRAVHALAAVGSRLYIAGAFTSVNGTAGQGFAVVDADSGVLASDAPGISGSAWGLAATRDRIFVGTYRGTRDVVVALRGTDGTLDPAFRAVLNGSAASLAATNHAVYVAEDVARRSGDLVLALDPESGRELWRLDAPTVSGVDALAVSGHRLLVATGLDGWLYRRVLSVDADTGRVGTAPSIRTAGAVHSLAVTRTQVLIGGSFLSAGGSRAPGLAAMDAATGRRVEGFRPSGGLYPDGLAVSGRRLYAVHAEYGRSHLASIDLRSGRRDRRFRPQIALGGAAIATIGRRLYVVDGRGRPRALDAATGAVDRRFRVRLPGLVTALLATASRLYVGITSPFVERPHAPVVSPPGVYAFTPTGVPAAGFAAPVRLRDRADGIDGVAVLAAQRGRLLAGGDFGLGSAATHHLVSLDTRTGRLRSEIRRLAGTPTALTAGPGGVAVATERNGDVSVGSLGFGRAPSRAFGRGCALLAAGGRLYVGGQLSDDGGRTWPNLAVLPARAGS